MYWEYDSRIGRRWNVDPVDDESISPYSCFESNPILMSDVNGDEPENSLDDDEPDDEFKRLKDGTVVKIGSKGGNAIDYIYQSLQACLMCVDTDNGRYNALTVETYYNQNYLFDEDDNYQINSNLWDDGKRESAGNWTTSGRRPASGQADQFDITDLIPSKAGAKWGLKTLGTIGVAVLKKSTKEFAEKKVLTTVAKALVKTSANSKSSKKAQIIYGLQNKATKGIEKVGISSAKVSKKTGVPYRGTSQISKANKVNKVKDNYVAVKLGKVAAGKNARAKGLKLEQKITNANKATINPKIHTLPKPE